MSKIDKLLDKLINETISAKELRTLLKMKSFYLARTTGSHEHWRGLGSEVITLATHSKEVPRYQIKQVKKIIGVK